MRIVVAGTFDPRELLEAALEDVDLSGLGDYDSEYETTETVIELGDPIDVTITLDVDRVEGRTVSKDTVETAVLDVLGEVEGLTLS